MYNTNRRQYILKTSSGQYFNMYYKPYTGICLGRQTDSGTWTSPTLVLKNALPGFSTCLDTEDNIHMLCQDEKSNILYGSNTNNEWHFQTILKNKGEEIYDKHPLVYCHGTNLYFFYIIESSGKRLLYCQEYRTDDLYAPRVVDYVKKHSKIFTAICEAQDILYIFYNKPSEKGDIIGYRILHPTEGTFDDFLELKDGKGLSDGQVLSISAVWTGHSSPQAAGLRGPEECPQSEERGHSSGKGERLRESEECPLLKSFHLCMQKATTQKYELAYTKISYKKENCIYDTILASSPYPFTNSSLFNIGKRLIAYWVREDSIYYCISADSGSTWSKPEKYNALAGQTFFCMRIISNVPGDNKSLGGADLPASISDGFRPAFLNDFKDGKEDNEDMEDFKTSIFNTLKIISNSIEEINKAIRDTENTIKNLEIKMQHYDNILEKHSAYIYSTKEEMVKAVTGFETLKAAVDSIKTAETNTEKKVIAAVNLNEASAANYGKNINRNCKQSVLPGTGFAHITYDYLRNMDKNK